MISLLGTNTDLKIAKWLGLSQSHVSKMRTKLGLDSWSKKRQTAREEKKDAKRKARKAARATRLKKLRATNRRGDRTREKAKKRAEWVREQRRAGRTLKDIGKELGVSKERVRQYVLHGVEKEVA